MIKKFHILLWVTLSLGLFSSASATIKVASLHPILSDILKNVSDGKVEFVEVVRPGTDIHQFTPKSADVSKMQQCSQIYAMGKGLEFYLDGLRDSLGEHIEIIEVGRTLPSQKITEDALYQCLPVHAGTGIDPHWWHNVKNAERATKVIYKALSEADPDNASVYKSKGEELRKKYRNLHSWVKSQVSQIPKNQRVLVTAHVAFAYFCKEYGFDAAYLQGLSREGKISAKDLAETVKDLKQRQVKAVFPEKLANPKMLSQIAKEIGAQIGTPLYADDVPPSYEQMIFHNVNTIVGALR